MKAVRNLFLVTLLTLVGTVQAQAAQASGGSNTGGSGRATTYAAVSAWCSSERAFLEDTMTTTFPLKAQNGDKAGAIRDWKNAFSGALKMAPQGQSQLSVTYEVLERGLELMDAIEVAVKHDINGPEILLNFAQAYYKFLTNDVTSFDLRLNLEYRYLYERCEEDNSCPQKAFDKKDQYEDEYLKYAKAQLQWITGSEVATDQPDFGVAPKWSAQAFVKMTELVSGYVSDDIQSSIFSADYACLTNELDLLAAHIKNNDLGDMRQESNIVFGKLKHFSEVMKAHTCGFAQK